MNSSWAAPRKTGPASSPSASPVRKRVRPYACSAGRTSSPRRALVGCAPPPTSTSVRPRSSCSSTPCRDGLAAQVSSGGVPAARGAALLLEPGRARALGRRGGHAAGGSGAAGGPHPLCRSRCLSTGLLFICILLETHPIRNRLGSSGTPPFGALRAAGNGGARSTLGGALGRAREAHSAGPLDAFTLPAAVRAHVPLLQLAGAVGHCRHRVAVARRREIHVAERGCAGAGAAGRPVHALRLGHRPNRHREPDAVVSLAEDWQADPEGTPPAPPYCDRSRHRLRHRHWLPALDLAAGRFPDLVGEQRTQLYLDGIPRAGSAGEIRLLVHVLRDGRSRSRLVTSPRRVAAAVAGGGRLAGRAAVSRGGVAGGGAGRHRFHRRGTLGFLPVRAGTDALRAAVFPAADCPRSRRRGRPRHPALGQPGGGRHAPCFPIRRLVLLP